MRLHPLCLGTLLLGVAALPGRQVAAAPASAMYQTGQHHVVCTSQWQPMVTCQSGADPSTYSGFDIELFRRAAVLIGWDESTNTSQPNSFAFRCMGFDDMLSDLVAPNGTCTLATAGITISTDRMDKGILFSYPTYRASLAIMTHATETKTDGWYFLKPFNWTVWLAILLTVAAIPLVTFVMEFMSVEGRIQRHDWGPGLKEAGWRSMWTMMLLEPYQVTAVSARIIAIIYGFLATVIINTYCANLTAALTVSQLTTSINSVDDLRGKAVGTLSVYVPRLAKWGIAAVALPFQGMVSAGDWVAQLRSGMLLATAVDEPLQQYVSATMGCDLQTLPDTFEPFDYGMAFRVGMPEAMVSSFSDAVLSLQEDGTLTQLRTSYIAIPRSDCDATVNSQTTAILFQQVSGLWVILAAGFGVSILYMLLSFAVSTCRRRQRRRTPQLSISPPDGKAAHKEDIDAEWAVSHPAAGQAHQHQQPRHYKPGVAFRQTVSIFGAQIGTLRREAAAAAADGIQGSSPPSAAPAGTYSRGGSSYPRSDEPVAELLCYVRHLCDRLEKQAAGSGYMQGGQKVVDERIEEVRGLAE